MIKYNHTKFKTVLRSSNNINYKFYLYLFPIILTSQNVITVLRRYCKEDVTQARKKREDKL